MLRLVVPVPLLVFFSLLFFVLLLLWSVFVVVVFAVVVAVLVAACAVVATVVIVATVALLARSLARKHPRCESNILERLPCASCESQSALASVGALAEAHAAQTDLNSRCA